jgi:hypothetical protein
VCGAVSFVVQMVLPWDDIRLVAKDTWKGLVKSVGNPTNNQQNNQQSTAEQDAPLSVQEQLWNQARNDLMLYENACEDIYAEKKVTGILSRTSFAVLSSPEDDTSTRKLKKFTTCVRHL